MSIRPKLRTTLLAAALGATAASAWAAYTSSLVPSYNEPSQPQAATEPTPLLAEPPVIANEQGIAPNEQVVTEAPAPVQQPIPAPVVEAQRPEPAITIEQQRLTVDERIQADVMDVLARSPYMSGKIGVVSQDSVVTLTGWTTTSGMAWRAGRDARGVPGVRHVVNEIRPRVGGITS
jgi:hypothetical protein